MDCKSLDQPLRKFVVGGEAALGSPQLLITSSRYRLLDKASASQRKRFCPCSGGFPRPDVAYITVSQCDFGLHLPFMPTVVVLSAGGCGNVPVPLLAGPKSVENLVPMDQRPLLANDASSLFHASHDVRHLSDESMNRPFQPNEMFVGRNASWEHIMADIRVSLVPRGVERGVFHVFETVQMGLVPVYVCDDVPWVPYKDMFEQLGYVLNIDEVEPFLKNLASVSISELEAEEARSLKVRDSHFSFPGVMRQIEGSWRRIVALRT